LDPIEDSPDSGDDAGLSNAIEQQPHQNLMKSDPPKTVRSSAASTSKAISTCRLPSDVSGKTPTNTCAAVKQRKVVVLDPIEDSPDSGDDARLSNAIEQQAHPNLMKSYPPKTVCSCAASTSRAIKTVTAKSSLTTNLLRTAASSSSTRPVQHPTKNDVHHHPSFPPPPIDALAEAFKELAVDNAAIPSRKRSNSVIEGRSDHDSESSDENEFVNEDLYCSDRKTCAKCGFRSKNEKSLKEHIRCHHRQSFNVGCNHDDTHCAWKELQCNGKSC
jgi:hypothetical protein